MSLVYPFISINIPTYINHILINLLFIKDDMVPCLHNSYYKYVKFKKNLYIF